MAIIRALNNEGIAALREFLLEVRQDASAAPPLSILHDERTSDPLPWNIDVEPRAFASRFEAAQYLYEAFRSAEALAVERERGLWAWLSLFYFDSVCPEWRGRRRPGEAARWVLNTQRLFRHLLAGPYAIYKAYALHPEDAMIVLCQPVHRPGKFVDDLSWRRDLLTTPAVVAAATRLYYDGKTGKPRRRAQSATAPGNFSRFIQILRQLDVTWDLYSLTADALLWRLPQAEFGLAYRAPQPVQQELPTDLL